MSTELINYNGQLLSLNAIAAKESVVYKTLLKYYSRCNNIEDAILMAKLPKNIKKAVLIYDGEQASIEKIARLENVDYKRLLSEFEKCCNIYKAVTNLTGRKPYIEVSTPRPIESRSNVLHINGNTITREEFAKRINMPILYLNEQLSNRKSAAELEIEYKSTDRIIQNMLHTPYEDGNLLNYCVDNNLDYTAIGRFITIYGVDAETAVKSFIENNNHINIKYVKEKYDALLSYLQYKYDIDKETIYRIICSENVTIEDALVKYFFRVSPIDDKEHLEDIYNYIIYCSQDRAKVSNILLEHTVSDRDKELLDNTYKSVRKMRRIILLSNLSSLIDKYSDKNLDKLLDIYRKYELSIDEIILLYTYLYKPYDSMNNSVYSDINKLNSMSKCIKENSLACTCDIPEEFSKDEKKYCVDRMWLICEAIGSIYPEYYNKEESIKVVA